MLITRLNNKGFTLMELLAVIVVLGIIAAIAIPSVLKVIGEMRDRAFIANAWNMKEAADFYIKEATTSGAGAKERITYFELVENGYMGTFNDPDTDRELVPSDKSYVTLQNNIAIAVCLKGENRKLCTEEEGVDQAIQYKDLSPSQIVSNNK